MACIRPRGPVGIAVGCVGASLEAWRQFGISSWSPVSHTRPADIFPASFVQDDRSSPGSAPGQGRRLRQSSELLLLSSCSFLPSSSVVRVAVAAAAAAAVVVLLHSSCSFLPSSSVVLLAAAVAAVASIQSPPLPSLKMRRESRALYPPPLSSVRGGASALFWMLPSRSFLPPPRFLPSFLHRGRAAGHRFMSPSPPQRNDSP
jgi:hypothetical protein